MEKNMDNEMETGMMQWLLGIVNRDGIQGLFRDCIGMV